MAFGVWFWQGNLRVGLQYYLPKKYLQSNGTISYSIELLPMPANRVVCRFLKMPMLAHTKAGLNDLTRR